METEINSKYKLGDFYRDIVSKDILKILAFSDDAIREGTPDAAVVRFVKCGVWVCGVSYLGPQEMQLANFERADRFAKITGWRERWLKIRHFRTRVKRS